MDELQKRTLPDDTVEYFIYAFPQKDKAGSAVPTTIHQTLKDVKKAAQTLVDQHLKGYIWQREPFRLDLRLKPIDSKSEVLALSHIHGQTNFGDSIEDEWLVVWLLRLLSEQFPQLWIRAIDSMGEFLLVEAANVLPGWLDPDIAEHRVWINKGGLRLIPVTRSSKSTINSSSPAARSDAITLDDARSFIYDGKPTLHPKLVEDEAFHRLRAYPEQIPRNQHSALIIVPRKLAFVLHEVPSSITSAIDAFYLRDPISLGTLLACDSSSLAFPPKDFVTLRTRFTRVSFAQARAQRFEQPPAWSDADDQYEDAKQWPLADAGLKVCAGFEMLLGDPQRQDDRTVREIRTILEDIEGDGTGLPTDEEIRGWGTEGDDEKWLDIDFRDFEDELSGRKRKDGTNGTVGPRNVNSTSDGGSEMDTSSGFGDKTAQENLRKMVQRFEDFLNDDTVDAFDADDDEDDDDSDEENSDEEAELESGDASAPFTEDDFTRMMREMMGIPEDVMQEIMAGKMDDERVKEFAATKAASGAPDDSGTGQEASGIGSVGHNDNNDNDDDDDDNDDEEIRQLTAAMEAELRRSGALDLAQPTAPGTSKGASSGDAVGIKGKGKGRARDDKSDAVALTNDHHDDDHDGQDDDDADDAPEPLNADYNLVANMLESLRGQAGAPGPGGNLLGLLGLRMPRDEDDGGDGDGGGGIKDSDDRDDKEHTHGRVQELSGEEEGDSGGIAAAAAAAAAATTMTSAATTTTTSPPKANAPKGS